VEDRLGEALSARLRQIGEAAAEAGGTAYLVGGPVRDLLLEHPSPDLDIAIEGPLEPVADALADRLGARVRKTTQFMTCTLLLADGSELDIAHARTETYPEPGVLPVVEAAGIDDDLRRRDFTVNAMAVALAPGDFGELLDPHGGMADLQARRLRVLHDAGFEDDPTRMLRATRFMLRLGFDLEEATRRLLARAAAEQRLSRLSGARLRNELRRIFDEAPAEGPAVLQELGLIEAMGLRPAPERALAASALVREAEGALRFAGGDIRWTPVCLGIYAGLSGEDAGGLGERLLLDGRERSGLREAARVVAEPPARLLTGGTDSELYLALALTTAIGAVACWTVLQPEARRRLERYWRELRDISADITGADLIAAGYRPGPSFSDALTAALAAKLDRGAGRDEQLHTALGVLSDEAPGETT